MAEVVMIKPTRAKKTRLAIPNKNLSEHPEMVHLLPLKKKHTNDEYPSDTMGLESPDKIQVKYRYDLNIMQIDQAIRIKFAHRKKRQIPLLLEKQKLENDLKDALTKNSVRKLQEQISNIENEYQDIKMEISWNSYVNESKPYLEAYPKIATDETKGIIVVGKRINNLQSNHDSKNENNKKRLSIIEDYLRVASKYIEIDIVHERNLLAVCPVCGIEINTEEVEDDVGMWICPKCSFTREIVSKAPHFKDSSRINASNRNDYEDRCNFIKAFMRFQGKQSRRINEKLYDDLDEYFVKVGKPKAEEIRSRKLINGKREGTSKSQLIDALSAIGYNSYYDDVNLIASNYWGWDLPDISSYFDQIMKDYDATQAVFNSIPEEEREREAALNTQWRLFFHLKGRGYSCVKEDFKIQVTRESLQLHQRLAKIMCDKTGVPFIEVI